MYIFIFYKFFTLKGKEMKCELSVMRSVRLGTIASDLEPKIWANFYPELDSAKVKTVTF